MKNQLRSSFKFFSFYFLISINTFGISPQKVNLYSLLSTFQTSKKPVYYNNTQESSEIPVVNKKDISQNVLKVLKAIQEYGKPIEGYVGGRKFGNYEGLLPKKDNVGRKINYQEWDIYPKIEGKNRGAERLITGSDKKVYFTQNHYKSFVEIK